MIWMPTEDAYAHVQAGLNRLAGSNARLHSPALATPPVESRNEEPIRLILSMAAEADALIATRLLSG